MILFIYNIVINIIYFCFYPIGRAKAKTDKLYRGRLGLITPNASCDLWLHAASVGEVRVIGYLINYLLEKKPELKIHLTTMTRTGYKTADELYSGKITKSFFPLDKKSVIKKTLDKLNPKMIIIAETEIWPNLVLESSKQNIPMILVNGRMSEKAFGKYKKIKGLLENLLGRYNHLFLKTEADKKRYGYFNTKDTQVTQNGDMKFDAPIVERTGETISKTRSILGVDKDDFLLTAGSTRPGEEQLLVEMLINKTVFGNKIKLILAPRHIKRLDEIKNLLKKNNLPYRLYGETGDENIILIDRLGLLNSLYLASDLAFVGGTLVNIGGHNILEPVYCGVPVVFGNHIENVAEAADYINTNNFGKMINNTDELAEIIYQMLNNEIRFNQKSSNDLANSATSQAGNYILQKLKDM